MKKAILVMLIGALSVTGAMADDFYLGFGGVAMVQDKSVEDAFRFSMYAGYGIDLTDSLVLGIEGWLSAFQLGEESYTYDQLVMVRPGWFQLISDEYRYEIWDMNYSPRLFAKLKLDDDLGLSAFVGYNYNRIEVVEFINDERQGEPEVYDGVANQGVAGARLNLNLFYIEYTRSFNLGENGDVNWDDIAANRLGLGIYLQF
jgi:hypothetical protein